MGKFVVIEGPNGTGKTTCVELLKDMLEKKGLTVNVTKEPSDLGTGKWLRESEGEYTPKVYAFLIAADRCNHVEEIILPSKNKYDVTICDRYIQSSLVLQQADGVEERLIWDLNCNFIKPDLSFVLVACEDELNKRLASREKLTYFENKFSRRDELDLYKKTTEFLKRQSYDITILENNNSAELRRNVNIMCNLIEKDKI